MKITRPHQYPYIDHTHITNAHKFSNMHSCVPSSYSFTLYICIIPETTKAIVRKPNELPFDSPIVLINLCVLCGNYTLIVCEASNYHNKQCDLVRKLCVYYIHKVNTKLLTHQMETTHHIIVANQRVAMLTTTHYDEGLLEGHNRNNDYTNLGHLFVA